MHHDKNRNEKPLSLEERRAEFAQLPGASASILVEYNHRLYQFIRTDDGSPSLRMAAAHQRPEAMHHSGGALSESLYIYGEAFEDWAKLTASLIDNFRLASVGLGLGYNEWIALALAIKASRENQIEIDSFEDDKLLNETFLDFINDQNTRSTALESQLTQTFNDVLLQVAAATQVAPTILKQLGQKLIATGRWAVRGRLDFETQIASPYSVIFYDAFSGKATPELWSEEFLVHFMKFTRPICVFSTYAATAALKRALKHHGFQITNARGFNGKRESTRALRYGTVI